MHFLQMFRSVAESTARAIPKAMTIDPRTTLHSVSKLVFRPSEECEDVYQTTHFPRICFFFFHSAMGNYVDVFGHVDTLLFEISFQGCHSQLGLLLNCSHYIRKTPNFVSPGFTSFRPDIAALIPKPRYLLVC